ncbi:competence protein ComEA [Jeotgalicoccus coquinae]|mgnify:CR=1 FL=1|uniref:ComE operon protein 1 n=1 Tax=Jeotgalicoccus coquinae TaxID=709509 RepID=A0A6V7RA84_9STAP|nr:ComEA family DNA-binding protein [Jeotgalicoccus coquinae]MBB6422819.1 competence protein ComEA [Jeotgalicoccus coquinae]GGE12923.1 competence protein ComEA [Jeotgalicoccus coquinae]CAD2074083.1 ComE operon protein 1 [Jeotgalicoccus coquinae]
MDIKSFFEQYKFYLIGACAVLAVIVYFAVTSDDAQTDSLSFDTIQSETPEADAAEETVPQISTVFVEVKGAIEAPGVYELPVDARVKNVLDIAVLSDNADLLTVNQSAKLTDEMVIYIPYTGEIDAEAASEVMTPGSPDDSSGELVNINTAGIAELTTLNGIGEKKAQAIITYREEQGLFGTLEDLKNIPGIGDKTFENLKPYITIK